MARATTRTHLPLDRWAEILGLDPRHFNQVVTDAKPIASCGAVWKQYAWQEAQQVSREDVAQAIQMAEKMIEDLVGYHLLPTWQVDERLTLPRAGIAGNYNVTFYNTYWQPMTCHARWGHIVSGGIEAKTVIEEGATVVYSDQDGDGYPETATVTATIPASVGVTDQQEVALYFAGQDAQDEWEIRPLQDPFTRRRSVSISGNTITIVMQRELLVDPDLQTALDPVAVEGDVDANFVATVDVYWHRNDPQQQVTLMWSPTVGDACNCGDSTCPVCSHSTQVGCLLAQDYRQGIFSYHPATYDSDTESWTAASPSVGRVPDHLRLWYYSGLQDNRRDNPLIEMETQWERAVAYLSLTLLTRPLCQCSNVQALYTRMMEDLAANISNESTGISFQINDRMIDCPWGTSRGALMAWRLATSIQSDRQIGQAVVL